MKKPHLAIRLLEKEDEDVNEAIALITNLHNEIDKMFSFLVSSVMILHDLETKNYIGDDGETIRENLVVAKYFAEVDRYLARLENQIQKDEQEDVDVELTQKKLKEFKQKRMH